MNQETPEQIAISIVGWLMGESDGKLIEAIAAAIKAERDRAENAVASLAQLVGVHSGPDETMLGSVEGKFSELLVELGKRNRRADKAERELTEAEKVIERARDVFQQYYKMRSDKGTEIGDLKALANQNEANMLTQWLERRRAAK